ncbi:AcrR family transcriptional regulator [Catenulispora sp. GP43]|uniref:TetR/AcrR family transcriptional regulator n=1 Tax=Catenulispora sp. GP43 TaxID=3156263 RepID=UPI003513916B
MPEPSRPDLPLADDPPRERADAARNRALVLQAAWRLYTHGGVEALTTDAVAQEAGVGKGTVYRRFRDKSGLVAALLDDKEKQLQLAMIAGPAPLGPDGARGERRVAFVHAYLDYLRAHLDLLLASETAAPGARYRLGVYQFWKTHLTMLFAEDRDPEFRAYAVLALLDASLVSHLLADGWSWDRIRAGAEQEARR